MYRKISGLIFMFILLCSELAFGKMCFMNLQEHPVRFEVSRHNDPVGIGRTLAPGATGCLDMEIGFPGCHQSIKYTVVATREGQPDKRLGFQKNVDCFDSLYVQNHKLELNKDTVVCPSSDVGQPILFAHGFVYKKEDWDPFVEHLGSNYRIFRTTIPENDPNGNPNRNMDVRGLILASYIHWADNKCGIQERELISIGHSIGGLDLRYIVHNANADNYDRKTPYKSAADKLKGVFTIASAHIQLDGGESTCDPTPCQPPSLSSIGPDPDPPLISPLLYSDFTEQGKQFVAFRYSLDAEQRETADDGRYCVSEQTFGRFWEEVFAGRHREVNACRDKNCQQEKPCINPWLLTQTEQLDLILKYSADPSSFEKFTGVKE
jgi:hypothetical protein